MIRLDLSAMDVPSIYKVLISAIIPRPIAFISTVGNNGIGNLAPFSFFNGVCSNPPSLVFSVTGKRDGTEKDTLRNIRENRQFVVNSSNGWLADQVNHCSAEYPYGIDEMTKVGLTPLASELVKPARVAESGVQMECELIQLVPVGQGAGSATLVIGKILLMHVRPDLWKEGRIDPVAYDPLSRLGGLSYGKTSSIFDLPRPTV